MRRPSSDAGWTLLALAVLVAGIGFAMTARSQPDPVAPAAVDPTVSVTAPADGPSSRPAAEPSPTPSTPSTTRSARPSESATEAPPQLPEATGTTCASLTRDVGLRVLTLNTHGGRGPAGFDLARLARFILAADVDVALLQEVDRDRPRSRYVDMPAALARATGMEVAYGLNVHLGPRRGVSGVATLSRHPITAEAHTLLPNRPGLKQRGLLRTDLDVDGTTISVFNTHLENTSPAMRFRQLAAVRGPLAEAGHPVVLGGDLNAGPGSDTLRLARGFLRDAWDAAGAGAGLTAPSRSPRVRIDYLLYAPPLRAERVEVLPDLVSDHRGVRADLVIPAESPEICVPVLDGVVGGGGTAGSGSPSDR